MACNVKPSLTLDEQLEKATSYLSSDVQQKLKTGFSEWQSKKNKSISILVLGKAGSGKSTLTNAILGMKLEAQEAEKVASAPAVRTAPEGSGIKTGFTTNLEKYQWRQNDIIITVWDSPGLQDGTQYQDGYVQQMKEQCTGVDLYFYCVMISNARFVQGNNNPDVVAMKKLTIAFGPQFWQKTVIVLTYANLLKCFNMDWEKLADNEKAEAFKAKVEEWEDQIKTILVQDILVAPEIVEDIKVVPAGYIAAGNYHLPGQKFWLSNLWFQCLHTTSSPAQCALLDLNKSRFQFVQDVQLEQKDRTSLEEQLQQPIIFTENILGAIMPEEKLERVIKAMQAGGAIGGVVGGKGAVVGATSFGLIAIAIANTDGLMKAWKKAKSFF